MITRASQLRASMLQRRRKRTGILPNVDMNAAIADMINPENYVDEEASNDLLVNSKLANIISKQIDAMYTEKNEKEYVEEKVKTLKGYKN